jgi:hypothetical protein
MSKRGPKIKLLTLKRIKERSTEEGDCHIWNGPWHRQGYPMVRWPQTQKMRTTYSAVWELLGNTVPGKSDKAKLTRTCGNIKCVNPEHIVLKSMTDVMREAKQTGKGCKFTAEQIRVIRKEYDAEIVDVINNKPKHRHGCIRDLAIKYNCHPGLMWSICKRRLYKWVEQEN